MEITNNKLTMDQLNRLEQIDDSKSLAHHHQHSEIYLGSTNDTQFSDFRFKRLKHRV